LPGTIQFCFYVIHVKKQLQQAFVQSVDLKGA
jgi:hypothetical protein